MVTRAQAAAAKKKKDAEDDDAPLSAGRRSKKPSRKTKSRSRSRKSTKKGSKAPKKRTKKSRSRKGTKKGSKGKKRTSKKSRSRKTSRKMSRESDLAAGWKNSQTHVREVWSDLSGAQHAMLGKVADAMLYHGVKNRNIGKKIRTSASRTGRPFEKGKANNYALFVQKNWDRAPGDTFEEKGKALKAMWKPHKRDNV